MRGLILAGAVALASCAAPSDTVARRPDARLSSIAGFDATAFQGRWIEVAAILPTGQTCAIGGLTFTVQATGGYYITEGPCDDGRPKQGPATPAGPGRIAFRDDVIWVLWTDDTYQTAAIGTPDGRAHILSRTPTIRDDKLTAAREILDWNGFRVDLLRSTRPR